MGDDLRLYFKLKIINKNILSENLFRIIYSYYKEQRPIAIIEEKINFTNLKKNIIEFFVDHSKLEMSKGVYSINIALFKNKNEPIFRSNDIYTFQVIHNDDVRPPFYWLQLLIKFFTLMISHMNKCIFIHIPKAQGQYKSLIYPGVSFIILNRL